MATETVTREFEKISEEQFNKDIKSISESTLYDDIRIPERSTAKSAGYDFYSPISVDIPPCSVVKVPLGIKAKLDDHDVLLMFIRSSLASKHGIQLINNVGVVDADYYNNKDNEGHIWAILYNINARDSYHIDAGDKVCQGIIVPYETTDSDNAEGTRDGGFGSTGK